MSSRVIVMPACPEGSADCSAGEPRGSWMVCTLGLVDRLPGGADMGSERLASEERLETEPMVDEDGGGESVRSSEGQGEGIARGVAEGWWTSAGRQEASLLPSRGIQSQPLSVLTSWG